MPHTCLACGYPKLTELPRSRSGGGSYEICPSCGFQFGVTDDDQQVAPAEWRARWIKGGSKWSSRGIKPPAGWDARQQLAALKAQPKPK